MSFKKLAFGEEQETERRATSDVPENILTTFGRRNRDSRGSPAYQRKTDAGTQVGENALSSGSSSASIGASSFASEDNSTAVGIYARATGKGATVVGRLSRAAGARSTHVGEGGTTTGIDSTSVGQALKNTGARNTGVGRAAKLTGNDAIGVGVNVSATHNSVIIIGNNQVSTANDQIIIATDGNTALRVDSNGAVFVNNIEVGELQTPNTAETGTASITVSNTSGTWSSWNTAIASTSLRSLRLLVGVATGVLDLAGKYEYELATGGAGSEANIFNAHTFQLSVAANVPVSSTIELTMDIPASTRISVRARQVGATTNTGATAFTITMLQVS